MTKRRIPARFLLHFPSKCTILQKLFVILHAKEQINDAIMANKERADYTRNAKGKVIDPIDFTPGTIQGILPKEFALELVRCYKAVIAPHFDPAMKVMMFGSYAKNCPNEWSDIDVPIIVPKADRDSWRDNAISLNRATDSISCYIEPIIAM